MNDTERLDWFLWDNFGMTIDGYDIEDRAFDEFTANGGDPRDEAAFKTIYVKHGRRAIDSARIKEAK